MAVNYPRPLPQVVDIRRPPLPSPSVSFPPPDFPRPAPRCSCRRAPPSWRCRRRFGRCLGVNWLLRCSPACRLRQTRVLVHVRVSWRVVEGSRRGAPVPPATHAPGFLAGSTKPITMPLDLHLARSLGIECMPKVYSRQQVEKGESTRSLLIS